MLDPDLVLNSGWVLSVRVATSSISGLSAAVVDDGGVMLTVVVGGGGGR